MCFPVQNVDCVLALDRSLLRSTAFLAAAYCEVGDFGVIWLKAIILLAMPFVFGGIAVCLALTRSSFAVGLIYGMDLLGAATGCIFTLSVFLGHPVYALSIGLFSIIFSTGLGSLLSERLTPVHWIHFLLWLGMLAAYLFLLPQWLPQLTHSSLAASSLFVRAVASVVIIFPAGLLMGFGFPTGMRLVTAIDPQPTPWLWGVNGAAGVLAAGLAVACSIAFSVDTTIQVGGLCYILLLPVALLLMSRQAQLAYAS
jgi:hypothetical protein